MSDAPSRETATRALLEWTCSMEAAYKSAGPLIRNDKVFTPVNLAEVYGQFREKLEQLLPALTAGPQEPKVNETEGRLRKMLADMEQDCERYREMMAHPETKPFGYHGYQNRLDVVLRWKSEVKALLAGLTVPAAPLQKEKPRRLRLTTADWTHLEGLESRAISSRYNELSGCSVNWGTLRRALAILRDYWHGEAVAVPAAPQGWQPIETAPKDKRSVVLYWPHWSHTPVVGYIDKVGRWACEAASSTDGPDPTHWMPLPDPPVVTPAASQPDKSLVQLQQEVRQLEWVLKRAEEILADEHGKVAAYSITKAWGELPPELHTPAPSQEQTP